MKAPRIAILGLLFATAATAAEKTIGQDQRLADELALVRATDNATRRLLAEITGSK